MLNTEKVADPRRIAALNSVVIESFEKGIGLCVNTHKNDPLRAWRQELVRLLPTVPLDAMGTLRVK
jgi:hypothetical protein